AAAGLPRRAKSRAKLRLVTALYGVLHSRQVSRRAYVARYGRSVACASVVTLARSCMSTGAPGGDFERLNRKFSPIRLGRSRKFVHHAHTPDPRTADAAKGICL